jgi:hypothetical protein
MQLLHVRLYRLEYVQLNFGSGISPNAILWLQALTEIPNDRYCQKQNPLGSSTGHPTFGGNQGGGPFGSSSFQRAPSQLLR